MLRMIGSEMTSTWAKTPARGRTADRHLPARGQGNVESSCEKQNGERTGVEVRPCTGETKHGR